jgi:NAD(P) transhydrogenase subunit alpha
MVTIAVTAEPADEPRVAVSPETVKRLVGLGAKVKVESGAGARSRFSDDMLSAQGAEIVPSAAEALRDADVLLKVRRPSAAEIAGLKPGALVIAMLDPYGNRAALEALTGNNAVLFSMEFMPRITRAQSMDVLSSQANLAGYKAVIDAAAMFGQAMPMMMTAAGTVPAAKAFIMGAGVAGLQAIATARRLGAQVTATDVRPAAKEQVASLGAKFVAVEDEEFKQAQTAAGYAKPMSAEYQAKQAELVANHIKAQDIVITTALIPGRPAPRLITRAMVESMKPGAVIVDLAAERGGNCELTQPGQLVEHNGVKIFGPLNLAGEIPVNASSLYAKNLYAFLETLIDKNEKALAVNWDDEIVKGTLVARDGQVVHPSLQGA